MAVTPIKRFWNLLNQYQPEIRQIYTYAFFIGIINLTLPLGIQAIITYIQTGELTSSWIVLVGFVLFGVAANGLLQILQLRIVENIQRDLFTRSAFEFAYRLPKIEFHLLDKIHSPELVNRFFDTLTIQKGLPKILIDFSLAVFTIIFGLILLAVYSPYFIVLGGTLVFLIWAILRFTGPKGLETSLKESKYKYQLAYWLEEIARVNKSFKINPTSSYHLDRTDNIVVNYLGARESHFNVLLNQFKLFVGFRVYVAAGLLILGGLLVIQGNMSIGQFVAAEIVILLILSAVEKILRSVETIYDVLTALEKIGYVTDLSLDDEDGILEVDDTYPFSIRATEIDFGFEYERSPIISNLSFDIESGSKVVLSGASGTGKTILLQLMAGVYKITDGDLYLNGIPYNNYNRKSLTNAIGMSFSTNQLFDGSFLENITLGRDISNKDILEVIRILHLEEYFIHEHQGINTHIDSGGRRLPRSVIQRLLIARAIVHKPRLLLLEDPLQFVNDEEKNNIIDYIMHADRPWTVVVVADYPYWRKKCTQIIELKKTLR